MDAQAKGGKLRAGGTFKKNEWHQTSGAAAPRLCYSTNHAFSALKSAWRATPKEEAARVFS